MKDFEVVLAADARNGIGRDGDLPWHLPGDLAHFKRLTSDAPAGRRNAVLMGRLTWDSIPDRWRPLPARLNVVLSRRSALELPEGVLHARDLEDALRRVGCREDVARVFVVGGGQVYSEAFRHPACARVHWTSIEGDFGCDTTVPELGPEFVCAEPGARREENGVRYRIQVYDRRDRSGA